MNNRPLRRFDRVKRRNNPNGESGTIETIIGGTEGGTAGVRWPSAPNDLEPVPVWELELLDDHGDI